MRKTSVLNGHSMKSIEKLVAAGDLTSARDLCLNSLRSSPRNGDIRQLLLKICIELNLIEDAIDQAKQLLTLFPYEQKYKSVFHELLNYLHTKWMIELMEGASKWYVQKFKSDGNGWNLLGISYIHQGKFEDAKNALLEAVKILPKNQHVLTNLGNALIALGLNREAITYLVRAIEVDPGLVPALNNLGNAYRYVGQVDAAIETYLRGIALAPNFAELYTNLGVAYAQNNRYVEAIASYDNALKFDPRLIPVYANKADSFRQKGEVKVAIQLCEEVLKLYPDCQEVWAAYGICLRDASRVDEAIEALIKAQSYKNTRNVLTDTAIYTSLLFCLNYQPDLSAEMIYGAYREYNQKHGLPYMSCWKPFLNPKNVTRKLKVAYLSQSFYSHVCKHFLFPLIENHDRQQVEVFAYANCVRQDEFTEMYKLAVDHWVDTNALNDDELAERIRADGIDVLIDIAGHTNDNRLSVMARKPAPVSAHWLDFGYTTGLTAIDYYITDDMGISGDCQHLFSEKLWPLDGPFLAYRPFEFAYGVEVANLPAVKNGYITFGCLSRSIRINHKVIRVWAAILDAMPTSRLIIDSADFKDAEVCAEMVSRFVAQGIEASRLEIGFHTPASHVLNKIDISLDCFPHNSGMTLVESLYMGVPFISLAGRPTVGRLGASILSAAGLADLIAFSEEEYAQKAVILAHDIDRLIDMRKNLRKQVENSALMNEAGFARSMEKAYRQMWQIYCEKGSA
nr:tetratricopeptide repeat protein [uncultured Undibacterium sp.]